MDLLPTDDQLAISSTVADLLANTAPVEKIRHYTPGHGQPPAWASLADLGAFGLAVAESGGGAGLGPAELMLLFVELGRQLTPGPVLGTVLTAQVAQRSGHTDLLAGVVAGDLPVALAFPAVGGGAAVKGIPQGEVMVVDAPSARHCLVVTQTATALVPMAGLDVTESMSPDPCVSVGTAELDGIAVLLTESGGATWWLGSLLVAALQVGIAEATRDRAVAYAKAREQFGQPIGAFQAVKHRCAEMATRAEVAHFQTAFASLVAARDDDEAPLHVASARVLASEAARANAADNIVTHGAMGFSEEIDAHLFARRAAFLDVLLGTERWYLEAVAAATPSQG
jgi:alkylation response protein AidB-like acyl-CoA dehydrogenase